MFYLGWGLLAALPPTAPTSKAIMPVILSETQ